MKKKTKLTSKRKKKYIESKGSHCPYCGSTSISAESPETDGLDLECVVTCHDCNRGWLEIYTVTEVKELEGY
jgi:transcription elongation factor Elf1